MSVLLAKSVSVANAGKPVCRHLDFRLAEGEVWGILGPNGIGKTTLLHVLGGLRPPDTGAVLLDDRPVGEYDRKRLAGLVGILFQDNQYTFPATVLETVMMGRHPHLPFWGWETAEDVRIGQFALEQVALNGLADRQINTLSGGERRRLAIALLLTQQPRIWLLDEPTNHLDIHHQMQLLGLIMERARGHGGNIAMVLQDVNLVPRFCTHALLMVDADTRIQGPVDEVIRLENLELLYRHRINRVSQDGISFFYPA